MPFYSILYFVQRFKAKLIPPHTVCIPIDVVGLYTYDTKQRTYLHKNKLISQTSVLYSKASHMYNHYNAYTFYLST